MKTALIRILKIQPEEASKVGHFVLLFLLIYAGTAIGITASDSLFLLNVGSDQLPKIYVIVPAVMLVYIPVSTYLISSYGITRVFALTIGALVAGGVIFWFLLTVPVLSAAKIPIIYGAKIWTAIVYIAPYSLAWSFTYQFFDIQQAKRLFAFFTGGGALGAIMGGALINLLTRFIPVTGLYLVWSLLALAAVPVFVRICRNWKATGDDQDDELSGETKGFLRQSWELGKIAASSRYVLLLVGVFFFAQVLTTLNEYQYLDIFARAYEDEAALAGFFGRLYMGVNAFNLFVSVFVFNRLVLRFGVRNVALIQPVAYLIVFGWLYMTYGMAAGLLGFFAYQGLIVSVDYDNANLLLNALPSRGKAQVRTFIEGLAEPMATAIAGIFLLGFASTLGRETISLIGLIGCGGYFLFVLNMRSQYTPAMVSNLRQSWLDFSRNVTDLIRNLGRKDQAFLRIQAQSDRPAFATSAMNILWENDREQAADLLLDFLTTAAPEGRRLALPLFVQLLQQRDAEFIRRTLNWLNRNQSNTDIELLQEISVNGLPHHYSSPGSDQSTAADERATSALQSLRSWKPEERADGLSTLQALLSDSDEAVVSALGAIARSGDERFAHFCANYLSSDSTAIRRRALKAVERLVTSDSGRLLPVLLEVFDNGDQPSRRLVLNSMLKIGSVRAISPLLATAGRFTARERRLAVTVVEAAGLQGIPMAIAALKNRNFSFRGRAIAGRALANLAFSRYEDVYPDLVRQEVESAYRALYDAQHLMEVSDSGPGLQVLCEALLERRIRTIEFVLELLSIAGRIPNIELIVASLRSSDPDENANAIETIEQGIESSLFLALHALIDSRSLQERIQFYVQNFEPPAETSQRDILHRVLDQSHSIARMAAAQALRENAGEASTERLRHSMHENESPQFQRFVLELMRVDEASHTLVDRIKYLMDSRVFADFGPAALEPIGEAAELVEFSQHDAIFTAGEPADVMFLVIRGTVQAGEAQFESGSTFGEKCLFSKIRAFEATALTDCSVFQIPKTSVLRNVQVHPETGVHLLKLRREETK